MVSSILADSGKFRNAVPKAVEDFLKYFLGSKEGGKAFKSRFLNR
jgi:hypothetical protein